MKRVPRLSEYYEMSALYFFERGQEAQAWFQLMAAWFYEDEDAKEWKPAATWDGQYPLDLDRHAA